MRLSKVSENRVITLTTDFGNRDPFVGQMKGVILSINSKIHIVDITHEIENQSIEEASFVLYNSYRYFPKKSIHIAVVDPGVGSERRPIVAQIDNHFFVCPDNGILSYLITEKSYKAFVIENIRYMLKQNSPTFQGRDLFASAAAWLSKGYPVYTFGSPVDDLIKIEIEKPQKISISEEKGQYKIIGKIIHIDKFGNCITNIRIKDEKPSKVKIDQMELSIVQYYSQSPDKPAAILNSDDLIEIFVFRGNAHKELNLSKNTTVEVFING